MEEVRASETLIAALEKAAAADSATHTHVEGEEHKHEAPPAETAKPLTMAQKFAAKRAQKQMAAHQKRVAELKGRGLNDEQIHMQLSKEQYAKEPLHLKLMRLEVMVSQGMQSLAQEMVGLRQNDEVLADAMDFNFRSIARALVLAGVALDKQKEIMELVEAEVKADREARIAQMRKQQAQAAKVSEEKETVSKLKEAVDAEGVAEPPAEATSFGG